jgi:hypothetical protein
LGQNGKTVYVFLQLVDVVFRINKKFGHEDTRLIHEVKAKLFVIFFAALRLRVSALLVLINEK